MYAIFTSPFFIFLVTVLILIDNATLNGFLADGFHELQSQQSITVERSKKKKLNLKVILSFFFLTAILAPTHLLHGSYVLMRLHHSIDLLIFLKKDTTYLRNSYIRVPTYQYECSYFTKAQGMSTKSYLCAGQFIQVSKLII